MFHGLINAGRPMPGMSESTADRGTRRAAWRRLLVGAVGLGLLVLTLLPAMAVGAQSNYPPNTVISTYFDARYGEVSVVTDASGNLIDVNAFTGQRIYPVYTDYASAYTSAYVVPTYASANYSNVANTFAYGTGGVIIRQYSDPNSNCADTQVTQTTSGYYCTTTGTPAFRVS
ncbi:MAG: hypothetical protein ACYDAR_13780 [Thermomicrobiales bacterium]